MKTSNLEFDLDTFKNLYSGIIFDTDVLIKMTKHKKLYHNLKLLKENHIHAFYPSCYEYEWKSHPKDLELCRKEDLLLDLTHNEKTITIKKKLKTYPFDDGELNAYALAEGYHYAVCSDDRLPRYCYIVLKREEEIVRKSININNLLNLFFNGIDLSNLDTIPTFSGRNLFDLINKKKIFINDKDHSQHFYPPKEWLEKVRCEDKIEHKLFPNFPNERYKAIGRIFASIYACKPESIGKGKLNIGLKIKSQTHLQYNPVLLKATNYNYKGKIQKQFHYSTIAYNALSKYLKECPFLIDYINKNDLKGKKARFIGPLKDEEFKKANKFSARFQNVFNIHKKQI
jgi:hypothetical protein